MIELSAILTNDGVEETSNAVIQQVFLDQELIEAIQPTSAPLEEIEPAGAALAEETTGADPLDETELPDSTLDAPSEVELWSAAPVFMVPRAVVSQPAPQACDLDDPSLYFNQELSWLDFNWRVLWLALDERTPLLERVRFAAITASNLDEFYQKRVGGLKRQKAAGVRKLTPDGRTPEEQLELIREAAGVMHKTLTTTWEQQLKPAWPTKPTW